MLNGNAGHRPLNDREPKPTPKAPPCPDWLQPYAKEHWSYLAERIAKLGLLSDIDLGAFAALCEAWANYRVASEFVTQKGPIYKTPSGYLAQVPQVSMARQSLATYTRLAAEFGLTPASRTRIAAKSDDDGAADPWEALASQG